MTARRDATELEVVAMAVAAWAGARLGVGLAIWVGASAFVVAYLLGRPRFLIVAVFFLGLGLGARSESFYREAVPASGLVELSGRLLSDPKPSWGNRWTAEFATNDGARLQLKAVGPPAWTMAQTVAGTRVVVSGSRTGIEPTSWAKSRHLVGQISLETISVVGPPEWWRQPAEWLRGAVLGGGQLLGAEAQPLYAGLVIGEDRFQSESQRAKFRNVGLAHLLAVSGQNVAFALAVSMPLIRRLGVYPGFGLTLAVLFWFALATRLEPSVLRATATAAIAAWSVVRGTRANGVRALAITVVVAIGVDPMLVHSLGFSLSVLASGAIVVGSAAIERRLRGPRWLTEPAAVTLSAQLGVAPLLIATFGPMSVAALPANLAAGWAAGLVMVWGLSGGVVAHLLPTQIGTLLQVPVGVLVWWIDFVAAVAWRFRLPSLGLIQLASVVALVCSAWLARYQSKPVLVLAVAGIIAVLLAARPPEPSAHLELAGGGTYCAGLGTEAVSLLVVQAQNDQRLIQSLVDHQISSVDVVVFLSGNRTTAQLAPDIKKLANPQLVLAPPQHVIVGAKRVTADLVVYWTPSPAVVKPDGSRRLQMVGHLCS